MIRLSHLARLATFATLLSALGAVTASPAHAADKPSGGGSDAARVAELNESGSAYYTAGEYRLAIERFVEAYAIDHDPNLLFNLGRCYEKLGETDAAIEKYQAFVATPGADADGRLRAEKSLSALVELRDAERATGERSTQTTPLGESHTDAAAKPASSESSVWILPWATLGGGIVLAGTGGVLYALGASDHDKVTSAPGYDDPERVHPMTEAEAESYVRSGDTKKVLGGVALGLGGALVATSVVLFVTGAGRPSPSERSSVAIAVDGSHEGASVTVAGSF